MAQDLKFDVFYIARFVIFDKELFIFIFKVHVTSSQYKQVNMRQHIEADLVRLSGLAACH